MAETTFYLLDHDLKTVEDSNGGHSLTFVYEFLNSGEDVEILAHRTCDIQDPRVYRCFATSRGMVFRLLTRRYGRLPVRLQYLAVIIYANLSYFVSLLRLRLDAGAILFAVNCDHFTMPALQLFAAISKKIKVVAYFQSKPTRAAIIVGRLGRFLRLRNFAYATEIEMMAASYRILLGADCAVIPAPLQFNETNEAVTERPAPPYRGLYIGEARTEKGFEILVQALPYLRNLLETGMLHLSVHCWHSTEAAPSIMEECVNLEEFSSEIPNIKVCRNRLSASEYLNEICQADFLIVPYRHYAYDVRSSGIVFEALGHAKPLVITEQLSFGAIALEAKSAIEAKDGDPESLAECVAKLVFSMKKYCENAAIVAPTVRARHSAHSVICLTRHLFDAQTLI